MPSEVDPSIALSVQPPQPNSVMNSLMGFFQMQNAMRQNQLGQLQLQQQQNLMDAQNRLAAAMQDPNNIDPSTGMVKPSVLWQADPTGVTGAAQRFQEIAKAQAETANTQRQAQLAHQQLVQKDQGLFFDLVNRLAEPNADLSDEGVKAAMAQTMLGITTPEGEQFGQQELEQFLRQPVEQRGQIIGRMADRVKQAEAAKTESVANATVAGGGVAPDTTATNAANIERTQIEQSGATQRTGMEQAGAMARAQYGASPAVRAGELVPKEVEDIQTNLANLNIYNKQLEDLKQGLVTGIYDSGPIKGNVLPGFQHKVAAFDKAVGAVLPDAVAGIKSAGATMRLAQPEIAAIGQQLPNKDVARDVNIQTINNLQAQIARAQQVGRQRLLAYQGGATDLTMPEQGPQGGPAAPQPNSPRGVDSVVSAAQAELARRKARTQPNARQ